MNFIDIIGIGMGRQDLTPFHMELIQSCELLVGGCRQLALFPEHTGETLTISRDIPGLINEIKQKPETCKIVVLASGDPLFFGIGGTLAARLPKNRVRFHPNISSVAAAFSKVGLPWNDARIVSFHSRMPDHFDFMECLNQEKTFFLTAPQRGPGYIASELMDAGISNIQLYVLENLGNPDLEKVSSFSSPAEVQDRQFSSPNVVLAICKKPDKAESDTAGIVSHETHLGMPDHRFSHSKGLITKSEVRAISLSKLVLTRRDHVLWDIGAGSGSVGIEAAALLPMGQVIAMEKNPGRLPDIQKNINTFGLSNIQVRPSDFPDGGEKDLLPPDRIFIGGGGRGIDEMIACAATLLRPGGIIVINSVVMDHMVSAVNALKRFHMNPETIQVQISRSTPIADSYRFEPLNPVWIISGKKTV